jgi:hypothetical protein
MNLHRRASPPRFTESFQAVGSAYFSKVGCDLVADVLLEWRVTVELEALFSPEHIPSLIAFI